MQGLFDGRLDTGTSETTALPHIHECDCGAWICQDELCGATRMWERLEHRPCADCEDSSD